MFERILVPLDGSLRAELILGQIGRLLRREDSKVLLLRVLNPDVQPRGSAKSGYLKQEREEAEKYIEDLVLRFVGRCARVDGRVVAGQIAEVILKVAHAEHSSMIAMTTHGRSGVSRWIMGSVAEKVVRATAVPVLLVRSYPTGPGGSLLQATAEELPVRKILVPVDGSRASETVVHPAKQFAQLFSSELLVLHAEFPFLVPGPEFGAFPTQVSTPSEKDETTEGAAEVFRGAGLRVTRLTELGDPASVILGQCQAANADMIAMSTHGRSGVTRWVLGSVAERVLRHASVPILLVPARDPKAKKK